VRTLSSVQGNYAQLVFHGQFLLGLNFWVPFDVALDTGSELPIWMS